MESKLKVMIKWLKGSGLKVNENKTEACIFYRKDTPQVEISVNNVPIITKDHINVLGVIFDTKLTWSKHSKANKKSKQRTTCNQTD